ncbi:MAG: hypothetical protein U0989_07250 [Azonexus sp.]|nr:hypothetical protein [Azonexus sp.]
MNKLLPIFLSAFVAAGCATFGGDMIIRVSGSVPVSNATEKSEEQCQLGMVSSNTGEQGATRDIPAEFSTTMMVVAGPKPKSYYFVAECDDGRMYRSNEVTVSSRSSYSRKFDLGTLVESVP